MNHTDEFLYTDIALQLFSTFANADRNEPEENKVILETLFQSLQNDYGDNPFFMPALIYAFMTHMNIVFSEIAKANDADIYDIRSEYINHYNQMVRPLLSESMSNRPSMHKEIMTLLSIDEEWEENS
jgi:hypothetical protein